jgi:glycerol-3-phosphate acyltransferase PlsX
MKIGLDAMGGDFAPFEVLKGAIESAQDPELSNIEIVLIGQEDVIQKALNDLATDEKFTIINAPEIIGMAEHPTKAVSQKRHSSINIGLKMLHEGELDAFAGAGNTGAMMVSSLYTVRAIEGIIRPSLSTVLPKIDGSTGVMLDVGANSDVKPETLKQFAVLGSLYVQHVLKIENPKVGLLSIGEEKEKGNLLTQAAYPLLEQLRNIHFIGNVEGRDLFNEKADVVVCDGFTGNIVLKACEGFFYNLIKRGLRDDYLMRFNFENYGGTPILGINKPVIIGHGISKHNTIVNMVKLAREVVLTGLIDKIKASL